MGLGGTRKGDAVSLDRMGYSGCQMCDLRGHTNGGGMTGQRQTTMARAVGATDEADTERGVMGHKKDTVLSGAETLQDTAHGQ